MYDSEIELYAYHKHNIVEKVFKENFHCVVQITLFFFYFKSLLFIAFLYISYSIIYLWEQSHQKKDTSNFLINEVQ